MEHLQFKSDQTAAIYVAHGLDDAAQEEFELHLMSCPECVDDVEAWRAIKDQMPREAPAQRAVRRVGLGDWRLAAALVGVGVIGAASGWYGHSFAGTGLDERVAIFNALPASRGALDCTALPISTATEVVVLRVGGVASDRRVTALDSQGRVMTARGYSARRQSDGSWLLQFAAASLARRAIRLESQGGGGPGESLGCISATVAPQG